jgi:L-fuculose-phosphate aldolase
VRRKALLETAQRMSELGLSPGRSGNVSLRLPDGFLITPSGLPYEEMTRTDLVELDLRGGVREGRRTPSSEWRLHRDLYEARRDAGAIVHAHAPHATALSCLRRDIPAYHYMVAVAGGTDIRCAAYATFGSEELARAALAALRGRRACLLANHGMIAFADTLPEALRLAAEVEELAAGYLRVLQVGSPIILGEDEMARVLERWKGYGAR